MSAGLLPGGPGLGVPVHPISPTAAAAAAASSGTAVSADAAAPVWQPWADVQKRALAEFKTNIDRRLQIYNQDMAMASQVYDVAQMTAANQTRHLETMAQEAYNRYMAEARAINDMIMGPAMTAYNDAVAAAHTRLWGELTPAERAYAQVVAEAQWTEGLANGGAKLA